MNKDNTARELSNDELLDVIRVRSPADNRDPNSLKDTMKIVDTARGFESNWPKAFETLQQAINKTLESLIKQGYTGIRVISIATSTTTPWYSRSMLYAQVQYKRIAAWYLDDDEIWALSSSGDLIKSDVALRNQSGKIILGHGAICPQIVDLSVDRYGLDGFQLLTLIENIEKLGSKSASK